ncbi:MAG: hypothetical protein D084_Lepto4C00324G0001, partial [Leptospirillum sp. Group IV 'UBA BS']
MFLHLFSRKASFVQDAFAFRLTRKEFPTLPRNEDLTSPRRSVPVIGGEAMLFLAEDPDGNGKPGRRPGDRIFSDLPGETARRRPSPRMGI